VMDFEVLFSCVGRILTDLGLELIDELLGSVQLGRDEFEMVVLGFRCIAPPCSMVVHGHCIVFWDLLC
jgi:hypothetical protein